MNGFQKFADWYGRACGLVVTPTPDGFVEVSSRGMTYGKVWTVRGLQAICEVEK